mmetsp:Transcript_17801/g.21771  ORF Transcript_17801/g.21771 Transcript_17801/m.21771 type:complete len:285 (+) Transcript_17801:192-1046(+)
MERLPTWVTLLALSVVIIAAIADQFPGAERSGRENYALATACISLIFSCFFVGANVMDGLGGMVIGNVVENTVSAIVVSLWIVAIAFIQSPRNGFATDIDEESGQEIIIYANLYFFSWLNFIAAVYLFGNVIRDNLAYNPKFSQWVLLFASSVVLTATSIALHGDICAAALQTTCQRVKYAVGVGIMGIILSSVSILATMFGYMGKILEVGGSVLSAVLYFVGVVILTSAAGPASTMGNMYFSVWGGCFCSFALLVSVLLPNRGSQNNEQSANQHQSHAVDEEI